MKPQPIAICCFENMYKEGDSQPFNVENGFESKELTGTDSITFGSNRMRVSDKGDCNVIG